MDYNLFWYLLIIILLRITEPIYDSQLIINKSCFSSMNYKNKSRVYRLMFIYKLYDNNLQSKPVIKYKLLLYKYSQVINNHLSVITLQFSSLYCAASTVVVPSTYCFFVLTFLNSFNESNGRGRGRESAIYRYVIHFM
jgi:hypothetical protein